jgi:phosphoserine phosphatase
MSDACMIAAAGVGVAFMPKDSKIAKATKNVVEQPDLAKVLEFRF